MTEETTEAVQVNVVSHNCPEATHHLHHKVELLPVVEDFLENRTQMSLLPVLPLFSLPTFFTPLFFPQIKTSFITPLHKPSPVSIHRDATHRNCTMLHAQNQIISKVLYLFLVSVIRTVGIKPLGAPERGKGWP